MEKSASVTFKRSPYVYLDSNATTPLHPDARLAMEEFFFDDFANPSSSHAAGLRAAAAVERARASVAALIGASPEELLFTSGASEALNLALFGSAAPGGSAKGKTVVTSAIEHHAVLNACAELGRRGAEVLTLAPRGDGLLYAEDLEKLIGGRDGIFLAAFMLVNNETGAIQPVRALADVAKRFGALVVCDAVQGFGKVPVRVDELGVDMLAVTAHKFYGPKGAGALFVKRGTRLAPLLFGGGHEHGLRAGTVNVPAAVGMARAAELAVSEMAARNSHAFALRSLALDHLKKLDEIGVEWRLNCGVDKTVAGTANVSFRDVAAEQITEYLSSRGVMVSAGSACSSGSGATASHVIEAMGVPFEYAIGAVRISFGIYNEIYDVERLSSALRDFFSSRAPR